MRAVSRAEWVVREASMPPGAARRGSGVKAQHVRALWVGRGSLTGLCAMLAIRPSQLPVTLFRDLLPGSNVRHVTRHEGSPRMPIRARLLAAPAALVVGAALAVAVPTGPATAQTRAAATAAASTAAAA